MLQKRGKITLFDEVDGISGKGDKGGIGAIIQVIKKAKCPVFLTANNIYQLKLRNLRRYCLEVRLKKLSESAITSYLIDICDNEGIEVDSKALLMIARNSDGDLRTAINDLQAMSVGKNCLTTQNIDVYQRDRQLETFEALRRFFTAKRRSCSSKVFSEFTSEDSP